ncbi:uncharacterized hydrophobic domain-containing protein [Salegentibacter agarivorans]|jgi:uncharacterized hydrophobic protein (TIGR00271 family)|uniref:Uncharacterized hydrophobic domain-containing protein n=2 Tax=Salegentibacter TaxID=143222 RepID=A0A1I2P5F8_9FLAO|nr:MULTISPECIES: DUF389 domain-containing protein [Salegentibacter]APS37720.1 hypothetical protein AO058_01965 [Salegentibacter sp. T436]MBO2543142.1 DUF389 domain-containing protein [Salegentibacter sp. BDJ18]SFG10710.1 uncharacterized hydrophobic domain-containing protein [Salegentibacter agarivorans]
MENNQKPENNQNLASQENSEDLGKSAKGIWQNIKALVKELLEIRHDTDRESTVEAVKKDISFKGHNAWILIFSIFVASVGLNVSSTAVVIGAMLISPLMGPIVGVGMSVAINDVLTLRKSFINLGLMVGLSVLTAYIYFLVSPVKTETPELIARTYPTILDVLVAIFGGLALIVAKTKKGTIASVILGVAIATALMPPLCTVGYGLAIGNWSYAGGALYLFSINAVFIALSTFVVTKVLGFPLVKYVNSKKRRRTAQIASTIAVIVMIPSVILFVFLLQEQLFETKAKEFIATVMRYDGTETIKSSYDYNEKSIEVYLIGNRVPQATISTWQQQIDDIEALKETELIVHQGADPTGNIDQLSTQVRSGILEDLYIKNQELIEDKDEKIALLEKEISRYRGDGFSFSDLSQEAKINYDGIDELGYSNLITTNFAKTDTIPTFTVGWKDNLNNRQITEQKQRFEKWLKVRLKLDTLQVKSVN